MQGGSRHYSYRIRWSAAPKIDLAIVELIGHLVYPEPFYRETEDTRGSAPATRPG